MDLVMASRRRFFQSLGAVAVFRRLGATAAAQSPPSSSPDLVRLNGNESPYGPFPSVLHAMAQTLERGNYYVGREAGALRQRLADLHGVPAASVILGVGSSEPLRASTQVFCSPGHPPVVAEPTFEAVAYAAEIAHIEVVKVPLTEQGVHDVEKMVDAARKNSAGLFYLCNPANPTATIITKEQLAWTVENLPPDTILVTDEAYSDFVDDPRYQSALSYVKEGRRVIVLKTFSKIYGLAGMRLGYAVAPPELISRLSTQMLGGMGLNQAVVAGAMAGLDDKVAYDRVHTDNTRVRRFVMEEFRQMGYPCLESQANFIMVDLRQPIGPVSAKLAAGGFAVGRLFPSLPNHLRITLGTMPDMQRFTPLVREILAAG